MLSSPLLLNDVREVDSVLDHLASRRGSPVAMLRADLAMRGGEEPGVEIGIALSVLLLGLAVALERKPALLAAAVLVGAFAVFHGHAHGTEMPANGHALSYAAGFVLATASLHALGVSIGLLIQRPLARLAGALTAMAGLALAIG